jgi:hypothetical protein
MDRGECLTSPFDNGSLITRQFRKIYRIVCAIQSVSGWVWDEKTGASITADSASSWDDYVKKHPGAKPFRNKGWVHFTKVALIMPSTASGSNVFHPTFPPDDADHQSVSPEPESPPQTLSDPQDVDDSDHDEVSNNYFDSHCSSHLNFSLGPSFT